MTSSSKADAFRALHIASNPVVLYNVWDAGGAKAVAEAGAKAIATGSWAVAAAHGFEDGENLPLDFALQIYARVSASTDLPVTVDFEGAYAADSDGITRNVSRLLETGAIGLNFEDQIVGGDGLYDVATQSERISAVRAAGEAANVPVVINARTDLFLKEADQSKHAALIDEAVERGKAYQAAGADCLFVPGLADETLIKEVCDASALPVNIMVLDVASDLAPLAQTGVSRISFGPGSYFAAMAGMKEAAGRHF